MHRWLVILNFIWGFSALQYDWQSLLLLPAWSLPWIVICPLFPFLLAIVWWQWPQPPRGIFWLAALPSAVYGILSLIFYPLAIWYGGFAWQPLLQIPWVWVYAGQAWYLLLRPKNAEQPGIWPWTAAIYVTVSVGVQAYTGSFGYIGLDLLPDYWPVLLAFIGGTVGLLLAYTFTRGCQTLR